MLRFASNHKLFHVKNKWRNGLQSWNSMKSIVSKSSPAVNQTSVNKHLRVGDEIHGFVVRRIEDVPELCLTGYKLDHLGSGAEHLHIERDDANNVFSVNFRTTPTDSRGVAHILEHLALCGSQKYPCRDPFMKMLHRSLATFMNAMTGPDYTMYPFSTQNQKDFYNLLSVYLDAAFFPRLRLVDFRQEGWRLEHQDINDSNSPIIIKGVVFNEMKGVFSSPSTIFSRNLQNYLFPSNTYSHESGGDPLVIPELTHEQLKEFHAKHYHPSNARFYTYGNFSLESHLSLINEYILSRFTANPEYRKSTFVQDQTKWSSPVEKSIQCQPDPLAPFIDKQTTVCVAYMLDDITRTHESFALAILCSLLIDGPNSPLYQALIDSGLGSDYSPGSGFMNYTKQAMFSIGLQGLAKDDVPSVVKSIERTLKEVSKTGFPQERIEAILHRVELSTKHQSSNFGLHLLMSINPLWNHDGDPLEGLKVNEHVENFRNKLKNNPNLLKDMIKEYFLTNKHKLVLQMGPSNDFESNQQKKEQEVLNQKLSQLNEQKRKQIYDDGIELAKVQQNVEDLSVLPTLSVKNDISRRIKVTNIEQANIRGVPLQWSPQPTNGITYFNAVLKLNPNQFPQHLVPYLPLFSQVVTKLGTKNLSHKELDQEIQLRTGGLNVTVHTADHPSACDIFEQGLTLSSYCLERNIESMFKLWTEIFTGVRFQDDPDLLIQLVKMVSAEHSMNVPYFGHRYAMIRAAAKLGNASKFRELTGGLTALYNFRKFAASENVQEIIENLKSIASFVFQTQGLRCAINAEAPTIRPSLQIIERFFETINSTPKSDSGFPPPGITSSHSNLSCEHHVFPFSNNYLGRAHFCAPFTHEDHAKIKIASRLVSAKFLHREIREKGGAYGSGATVNRGGVFSYYSYRDPHIDNTIESFDGAVKWLLDQNNYTDEDIDEAKLSTFQEVDQPIMPGQQGMDYFINGISDEMKHEYRIRLLEVTKNDIVEATKRFLVGETGHSGIVLIGPRSDITISNSKWEVIEEKPAD